MFSFLLFLFFFSAVGLIAFLFFHLEKSQRTSIREAKSYLKEIGQREDVFEFRDDLSVLETYHDAIPLVPHFVSKITNIGVLSDRCFPITPSGVFLYSYQDSYDFFQNEVKRKCKRLNFHYLSWFRKKKVIFGTVAILGWIHESNYYHWVTEVLGKLALLQKSKIPYDKILISVRKGHTLTPYQVETLEAFGIHVEDSVTLCSRPCRYALEQGLVVTPPHTVLGTPSPWFTQYLKDKILSSTSVDKWKRKIYITREDSTRKIVNEDDLMMHLEPKGFEKVCLSNLSVQEQAKTFAEASIIIAPHGAGLTNLLFCFSGTRLIEIFPPKEVVNHFAAPYSFKNIANALLLKYDALYADSLNVRSMQSDLEVDIPSILDLLSGRFASHENNY